MNREQAARLLPVIQAFKNGKKVGYRDKGTSLLVHTESPTFTAALEWEVVPNPMIRWGVRTRDGKYVTSFGNETLADAYIDNASFDDYVKFKMVEEQ